MTAPVVRPDAVSVVVLRGRGEETRVLLLRRGRGAFAGAWTFVMGTVEPGENGIATARRELLEETGLLAEQLYTAGVLDAFYDPVKDKIVHVPFFVARCADGAVVLDPAHDAYRWASFAEAEETLMFSAQRRVLEEVHRAFVAGEPEPWRTIG